MAGKHSDFAGLICIGLQGVLLPVLAAHADSLADSVADDRWGGSVAVTTDYIYRGISQSQGESALQGGLQWQPAPGWSVGAWGSTVDFGRGRTYEIDLHASRSWSLTPNWSAQLGVVHYEYPNDAAFEYDYDEVTASLSFQQRVTASVSWTPNSTRWGMGTIARDLTAIAYELTMLEPLGSYWSICAGVGRHDLSDLFGASYWFWNVGVAFSWEALQIDLLHIDTDDDAERLFGYKTTGGRWTAALTWRF